MTRFGLIALFISSVGIIGCGARGQKSAPSDKPGPMVKLPSGLQYEDINIGSGPEVTKGKVIDCIYTGWLKTGKQFDSNVGKQPFSVQIGVGDVIPGWDEGIPGMKQGGKRKLFIPPELGYGGIAKGPIPAWSDLVFEVEVVKVR